MEVLNGLRYQDWQRRLWPGLTVIILVTVARAMGVMQGLEGKFLDAFLRSRPDEGTDQRILIVGIDEQDIDAAGTYPISDRDLARLMNRLGVDEPRVIGLDIFRDLPVEPGHQDIRQVFRTNPHVFAIEKLEGAVAPPHSIRPERVGFSDFPLDQDGMVRRATLGRWPDEGHLIDGDRFRFSLALKLAETYLDHENLDLNNGIRNPEAMRFGSTELGIVTPNAGAYVGEALWGTEILISPRAGSQPFDQVSMADVLAHRVEPELIQDRVVLIGITASSVKDQVTSRAVHTNTPGLMYGVEMHAHIISQLLSTVLDGRPMLWVWSDPWEYLWIIGWGLLPIAIASRVSRPSWQMLVVGTVSLLLTGGAALLLWLTGLWLPVVPALMVFGVNGWVLPSFYLYDKNLRTRIDERQRVIEETYDEIHNGPLQTLALILREPATLPSESLGNLEHLNQEIRIIYERMTQNIIGEENLLWVGHDHCCDLQGYLHELLYEVYDATLSRKFPGFSSIKIKVISIDPLHNEQQFSLETKRHLCRFLEEALCNVGKYAVEAKRLKIICESTEAENRLYIEDNGKLTSTQVDQLSVTNGRGTQSAQRLGKMLNGKFQRNFTLKGTTCELRWPHHQHGSFKDFVRF